VLSASLKSLLGRKLRLLMSAIAVILGVAFVAGSFIFTDTLAKSFDGIMSSSVGDVVVRPAGSGDTYGSRATLPGDLVAKLATAEGAARVDGNVTDYTTFVVTKQGKLIGGQGAPGMGVNYTAGPAANDTSMFRLTSGSWPAKDGEITLDARTAKTGGYAVGDTVKIVTAGSQAQVSPKLVGTMEMSGSLVGASVTVWTTHQAQQLYLGGKNAFNDIWVTRDKGTSQDQLKAAVAPLLPADTEAVTGDAAAAQAQTQIQDSMKFITYFLLIFAAIALVVGTFIIVNTFSILVAQRMRELALYRAIGASAKQVSRSVLVEAFVVGLIGATVGLAVGLVLAIAIKALFAAIGLDLSGASLVVAPRTILASYLVGILVTLLAAYLPARKAGTVPPVAAMRDDVTLAESSMHRRVLVGTTLTIAGAVALGLGLFAGVPKPIIWVGVGILGVLLGVAGTSPMVGKPLILGIGSIYRRLFGAVGVMAEENALRNPRRTAATASALMIGVTLVSMMSVFGSSAKQSLKGEIEKNFKADYLISNSIGNDFSPSIATEVAKVPGVASISTVRWGQAKVKDDDRAWVAAVDPASYGTVSTLSKTDDQALLAKLTDNTVILSADKAKEYGVAVGSTLPISLQGKTFDAKVAATFDAASTSPSDTVVSLATWAAHGGTPSDSQVYVTTAAGADKAAVGAALDKITAGLPTVSVKDIAGYAAEQSKPIDQMLAIIYALLGLAVVIAFLGIINTLALSVIERTREIGLLRAVGLSRRQLRSVLRLESIVIAILGAVLGIVLGVIFGIAVQRALSDQGFTALSVPWGQLLAFLVLAGLVGVLAAVWPGRRAAKMQILDAIAAE